MKKLLSILCCIAIICFMTGCQSGETKTDITESEAVVEISDEMKAAVAGFEAVAEIVEQKNNELDFAIETAETLLAEKLPALDETLIPALETAVSECKITKHTVPELPQNLEEIIVATEKMRVVDYTNVLTNLSEKQASLEDSIRRYSLVNAPSEEYVIECLKRVPNIIDIAAATEDNDPNGQLNKQGGYIAHVYFSSDLIDQGIFDETSVIENGTDCGGSIEVYSSIADVTRRNEYLSTFDGGVFASGSHVIVGTVLVRTSNELTASQQKALEANIIAALTDNEDAISEPLEPVEQTQPKEEPVEEPVEEPTPSAPNAVGVYALDGERIYLNSDGSYCYYNPENGGSWIGTWWQIGYTVIATYTWEGNTDPMYNRYESTDTLVDGGLMTSNGRFFVKIG